MRPCQQRNDRDRHCNSTSVYSGVVASGNGDNTDSSNLDATFLRGLQPTDSDGVAQFQTRFPGHYTACTNHIHVLVHFDGDYIRQGTYGGGYVSHVGQLFFDQDLITEVETVTPYSTNTQDQTTNEEDGIFTQEAATSDPMVEYSLVGDDVSQGLFGWIAFGVDLTNNFDVPSAASSLYEGGGVENENSDAGGPPGNGTMSGAPPSATPSA